VEHSLSGLVICRECDSVHRRVMLSAREVAHCVCCGATLARSSALQVVDLLALTIAAAIAFSIAAAMPVLSIEVGGARTEANAWTAALSMRHGWAGVAAVILAATTFVVPLLQIVLLLWLLSFARLGRRAPGSTRALVVLHRLRPWSMTEVFLLGALVAIVKLSAWVHVIPGPGLAALIALTVLMVILSNTDPQLWWDLHCTPR